MGTLTVNVNNDVEKEFRKTAGSVHGKRKGTLGKALTEAMAEWTYAKKQKQIAEEALALMGQGFRLGRRLYRDRSELYER